MVLDGVIDSWKEQYRSNIEHPEKYNHPAEMDKKRIYDELVALRDSDEEFTAEKVDKIIGIGGWTDLHCDGCGKDVEYAVLVGPEPVDYEVSPATLCTKCVNEALRVLREGKRNAKRP